MDRRLRSTLLSTLFLGSLACTGSPDSLDSDAQNLGAPTSLSFQNGVSPTASYAGETDTSLLESSPASADGSEANVHADADYPDGTGKHATGLLRFDVSAIPAGSVVSGASLVLDVTNSTSGSGYALFAAGKAWTEADASWNLAAAGSAWAAVGARGAADRGSTAFAAVKAGAPGGVQTLTLNAAGVAAVQAWVNGASTNHGLLLDSATDTDGFAFASAQATTASQRPRLTVNYSPPSTAGNGTGLLGQYFTGTSFQTLALSRTDATVNFDWGSGSPGAGVPVNGFSVRWTGEVLAPVSGSYTFFTRSDDGIRLWVNGQALIDNWTDHSATENSGTVNLTAGQKYSVKLEFYENGGSAVSTLSWSAPGVAKQVIPASQLFPAGGNPPPPPPPPPGTTLDETGKTIPDTAYAIPAGAIFMSPTGNDGSPGTQTAPVKTLNRAVALVAAGGTIVMRAGVYRDWFSDGAGSYKINTKQVTLQPYPHEQAWLDGSDVVPTAQWIADGKGHWYKDWSTPSFCGNGYYTSPPNAQSGANTGPCTHWDMYSTTYPMAGDPQSLFVDGNRMTEVGSLAAVSATAFYYDWSARRLYTGQSPSGHTLELAARPVALVLAASGGGMQVKGLGFRRYATNEYSNLTSGALYFGGGGGNVVQDCVFTQMSGQALSFGGAGNGSKVVHSVFAANGFNGVGGNGHSASGATDNFLIEGSLFNQQNLEHYGITCSLSCASAHIKLAHMVGWTVKNNIFKNGDPVTVGIWCDTACTNGTTVNNWLQGGASASGIHYEVGNGGVIANNVVLGFQYGINVGSPNVKVYNNTLIDQGVISLRVYDDDRNTVMTNVSFGNNISSGTNVNKLWFAKSGPGTNGPSTFISGLDYNAWFRPQSFVLYRWVDSTDTHFNSTADFRAAHGAFEAHSHDIVGGSEPFFVDAAHGDYTVRAGSVAYHAGGPIPADVAAAMGTSTAAGQSLGALDWAGK